MPKRRHKPRKPSRGPGRTPRRDHRDDGDEFLRTVGRALRAGPVELLELAAMALNATDTRRAGGMGPPEPQVAREDLVGGLLEADRVETTALLAAMAAMCGDELLAGRIRRELTGRRHPLPAWLAGLGAAQPLDSPVALTHVLGDGDDIVIGARLADGSPVTAVVYIDHNMGTLVKDAFVFPQPADVVTATFLEHGDADSAMHPLDPADARPRVTEAIDRWAMTLGPIESDTWPGCRPIVEWLVHLLPPGGRGYEFPVWSEKQLDDLAARFLASDLAAGLDDEPHRDMLDSILFYGSGWSTGDPMRWSPVVVEILLLDWIPRKLSESVARLTVAPDVLAAFVRFCHRERGIRAELTAETLTAIAEFTPDYLDLIRAPRLQGPLALLDRMGVLGEDAAQAGLFDPDADLSIPQFILEALARAVGGPEALDSLDDVPLPDEPFAWDVVPADVHERVREVLDLLDDSCSALLSIEYRTAARRLLADVAAADPAIFRRKGRADTAAAAVCWIVGKANSAVSFAPVAAPPVTVQELAAHLGLAATFSPSQRAQAMLHAIGVDWHARYGDMDLGTPRYLVGARRADLIRQRDLQRAHTAETDEMNDPEID